MLTWTWRSSSSPDGRMVMVPPRSRTGAPSRLQDTRGSGTPRAAQGSSTSCPSSTASSMGPAVMVGGTGWDRHHHFHTNNPLGSRDAANLPSELWPPLGLLWGCPQPGSSTQPSSLSSATARQHPGKTSWTATELVPGLIGVVWRQTQSSAAWAALSALRGPPGAAGRRGASAYTD